MERHGEPWNVSYTGEPVSEKCAPRKRSWPEESWALFCHLKHFSQNQKLSNRKQNTECKQISVRLLMKETLQDLNGS